MSYITRQDNTGYALEDGGQLTLYVERAGDGGIKFTILSRRDPNDAKSITLKLDQAAHIALDVAEAAIPGGLKPQPVPQRRD